MHPFLTVLLFAGIPALGNMAGGLIAEFLRLSRLHVSLALHAAAGLIVGVVGIELVPRALVEGREWISLMALPAGALCFIGIDRLLDVVKKRMGDSGDSGPMAVYFGVSVDLLTDGVLIGASTTLSPSLGLLLALGQASADLPEGFATIATLKHAGFGRTGRLLLTLSFTVPLLIGASAGYWILRDFPDTAKRAVLAFLAGILLAVTAEEIIPEAHKDGEARTAALFFVGGFALFAAVSIYLG